VKNLLILKAHHDICGDEIGLITHQAQFLNITVTEEVIDTEETMQTVFEKHEAAKTSFDFVYLCTHADSKGFDIEMGVDKSDMTWGRFAQIMCESGVLNDETVFLLACCRGGLFKVATDMFAVCNKINFVCGAKWTLRPADLATGFVVFLYNLSFKSAEPSYAAQKATAATDYTFTCHDRSEIESHPQYENRRWELYKEIGWADDEGVWVEEDVTIKENAGIV
jgi:hypothetical protein